MKVIETSENARRARVRELERELRRTLDPGQLNMALELARLESHLSFDQCEAELRRVARHFPGFEAALVAVLDHVRSADCETECGLAAAEVAEAG